MRLNAVLSWLAVNPGWLLILDNVDTPNALPEVNRLTGRLTDGHVPLTGRLDRFARQVEALELDVLSPDAAVAFLLEATEARRQKSSDDDAAAHELAEDLGRLALALEQAAATIEKLRCGFRGYLEIWRNNRERVVGWARPEITGYHHAVEATWQTSVDQLSEDGRHLIERLAFLAPDPVPMFLLDVAVPDAQAEDLHDGLTDLAAVSLTTVDVEGERFSVHRRLQDMTRRSLDATQSRQRITEVLGWVTAAFDGDPSDVRSWARLDPLTPHGLSVTQWADMVGIVEPNARLMSDLGVLLYAKSLHAQAEPLYRRACAIDEANLGPDHPHVAIRLNNLAALLQATNRLEEAEPLLRRALAIDEASFGPDHPTVANCLNNLALLLQGANRLAEAEPLYRRALAIDEASLGPEHPTVGTLLNNLAALLGDAGRPAEAAPLMRRVVAILTDFERRTGHSHPRRGAALRQYAHLLTAMGKSEAEIKAAIASLTAERGARAP